MRITSSARLFVGLILLLASPLVAFAGPSSFTYEGRLVDSNDTVVTGTVSFDVGIYNPAGTCLLYEESFSQDLTSSNGFFAISVGTGTRVDSTGLTMRAVFSNKGSMNGAACTYAPNSSDARVVRIKVNSVAMSPDLVLGSAPFAISADTLQGYSPSNFLAVDDATSASNTSPLNNTQFSSLMALINGTSTQYLKASANGTGLVPSSSSPNSLVAGQMWFDSATHTLKYFDGTTTQSLGAAGGSGTVTSITAGTGLTGGTISSSGTIALANTGTPGTYTKVTTDAFGRVTSGVNLAESDLPAIASAGKVSGSAITSGTITGSTAINTTGNIASTNMSAQNVAIFNSTNSHKITLTATTLNSDYNWILPDGLGANGFSLMTDGAGHLSWGMPSALPNLTNVTSITGQPGQPLSLSATGGQGVMIQGSTNTATSVVLASQNGPAFAVADVGTPISNYITVQGAPSGTFPFLAATGSDANINLALIGKGSGGVVFPMGNVGIGTSSASGAPLFVATNTIPAYFNSSNGSNPALKIANTTNAQAPSVVIGQNGTALAGITRCSLGGAASVSPTNTLAASISITCSGVPAVGATVNCSPQDPPTAPTITWSAYVSGANTIKVSVANTASSGTIPTTTWYCTAIY